MGVPATRTGSYDENNVDKKDILCCCQNSSHYTSCYCCLFIDLVFHALSISRSQQSWLFMFFFILLFKCASHWDTRVFKDTLPLLNTKGHRVIACNLIVLE